jgi:uncharacterized repeat protein (TIGR01451 family)
LRKLGLPFFFAIVIAVSVQAQESDVLVTKDGPVQSPVNTDVPYSVSVTNLGPDATATLTLTDAIPVGLTFVSGTQDTGPAFLCTYPSPGATTGSINCTIATLTSGSTADFTFVFHIPPSSPAGSVFTNVANVATATDPNPDNDSASAVTTTPFSDVVVSKDGPAESAEDTDVPYTVSVTNLGPDDTTTLTLTDAIPAGMTFVSGTQDTGPAFLCTYPSPGDTIGSVNCSIAVLTAGSTANFTFVFHIPPATPPGTAFTNIANVATATDTNSENDSATAVTITPFPPQGDLFVEKTGPTGAAPDSDVVYTITVGNAGPDDATGVTLNDTLPGTMTFVSLSQGSGPAMVCTTPGGGMGGLVSCTAATFPAGATATFTLTGHIPAGTPSGTTFANTATVTSGDDPNEENNSSSTVLTVASADVGVVKTGTPSVTAGSNITYTITVSNAGPDTALSVTLEDPLPPDTTFVSLTQNNGPAAACATPGVGTSGIVSCNFAALGNGASAQFTLVVEAGNTTSATNTATVDSDSADSNPANDSSTVVTSVTPSADVAVTKDGPSTTGAGGNVTYTVTVTNNGPSDAANVSLTDTLPANTTFVSATQDSGPAFSCGTPAVGGTGTITCTIDPLPAGATATFTFVLHVSPSAPSGSSIANTATVATTTADPNAGNDSSTSTATVVVEADVSVVKNGPTSIEAGTDITYNITVTNSGPSDASTISLTDTVPANTTFVSATQNTGPLFSCGTPAVGGTGTITCTLGTFTSGSSATFTFVMHVSPAAPSGGSIVNTADVTTATTDPVPGNNSSTTTAIVASPADLVITKTGPPSADQGTNVTYTVTVTNNGPADSLNVSLTDPVPANTTFVSIAQTSGPTFACATPPVGGTGTITCTLATFPPGSAAFDIVLHVNPQASGAVVNTATVTSPNDPTPANNAGTATTALAALAAVPTLSPLALALMALALAGIVVFLRR